MKTKTIIILILALLFVIIVLQNTQVVPIQFLFWKISMSRIILIPFFTLIGVIIGLLVPRFWKG